MLDVGPVHVTALLTKVGTTDTVAVISEKDEFNAANEGITFVPAAAKPIEGSELYQVNVDPVTGPLIAIGTELELAHSS